MPQPTAPTSRIIRRRAAALVVGTVVALVTSVSLVALPAGAQESTGGSAGDPPPTTATAAKRTLPEQAIVDATIRLYKVRADLADVERNITQVSDQLAVAEAALAETEAKLAEVRSQLADIRTALQSRAAIVYQRHSDKLGMVLSVDRVVNLSAGNHYANSVAAVDNQSIDRLRATIADLEVKRNQQEAIRRDFAEQKDRLERNRVDLRAEVDRQQAEIDAAGGVPIMGQSVLTAQEIAAWFKSTGQRARLMNDIPIDDLAEMYVSEGNAENVRGDIAFAQAVLETGSFGHAADNNFAGIGACDSCSSQYLFPTPRDGVRAQIQLLRNYADPFSRADQLKNPLDATLHGTDPVRAAQSFDSFSFKGRAPVWNVMGAGNWATDPLYAGKVLGIYSRMLAFRSGQPK